MDNCVCYSSDIEAVSGDTLERVYTIRNKNPDPDNPGEFIYTPYYLGDFTIINIVILKGSEVVVTGSLAQGNFVVSGDDVDVLELSKLVLPSVAGVYRYYIEFIGTDIIKTLIRGAIHLSPK